MNVRYMATVSFKGAAPLVFVGEPVDKLRIYLFYKGRPRSERNVRFEVLRMFFFQTKRSQDAKTKTDQIIIMHQMFIRLANLEVIRPLSCGFLG